MLGTGGIFAGMVYLAKESVAEILDCDGCPSLVLPGDVYVFKDGGIQHLEHVYPLKEGLDVPIYD